MADQENTTITQLRRSPRKTRRPNYTDPGSTRPVSGFGQKRSPKRKLQTTPPPAKRQCLRSNTNVSNQPSQPTSSEEDEQATCHELKAQICRLQALNKTLQRKVYAMEQELSPQRNSISKRKTSKDGHAHKAKRRNTQGVYVDGHEREDVVLHRATYLSAMKSDAHFTVTYKDMDDDRDLLHLIKQRLKSKTRTIVHIKHDECATHVNAMNRCAWFHKNYKPLRPKSNGKLFNVSGFLTESVGIDMHLYDIRKCGKTEGYWRCEDLCDQIRVVVPYLEQIFCESDEDLPYLVLKFVFDHSTNHGKYSKDALNVKKMNRRAGGKVPVMRDGYYTKHGQKIVQKMFYEIDGLKIPKGLQKIIEERGVVIPKRWKIDDLRDRLHQFEDFQNQKSMLEELIESMNHEMIMLPKFHCELNDMEIIWAISKGRHQRDNTFKTKTHEDRFRKALASISQTEVRHISVKIREYEQAYNQGATTTNVCEYIAKMKKARKTHKVICAPKQLVNNDLNNNI
eukprot:1007715_1